MKFFVTGGRGLIGSHLIQMLLKNGHSIKALRNSSQETFEGYPWLSSPEIDWVQGDILDVVALAQMMEGCDAVLHSAALVSFHAKDEQDILNINVTGTSNVVHCALENKIKKFYYISSVAALGKNKLEEAIDESVQWQDNDTHSIYAISKYRAEMEVWKGFTEGLEGWIIQPSVVLGAGKPTQSSNQLLYQLKKGISVYPRGWINVVDVEDLVLQFEKLLALPSSEGQRWVIHGHTLPYQDFFTIAANTFHSKVPTRALPNWALLVAGPVIGLLKMLGITLASKATLVSSSQKVKYTSEKVQKQTGIPFRPLQETLSRISKEMKPYWV